MAKVIEICGPPGVGKSTIFHCIEKQNKKSYDWSTSTNINPWGDESWSGYFNRIIKDLKKGRRFIGRTTELESYFTPIRRAYRTAKLGRNFVDQVQLKEAGDRFVEQHPGYTDACWHNIFYRQAKSSNGLDLRFEKAEFIYRIIKKIQVLREDTSEKKFIIDEGLINMIDRALYKSRTPEEEKQEIFELMTIMPVPNAIVYLELDLEENAKRLISRRDLRDMHRGLNLEELKEISFRCRERILTAINFLKETGTPVLVLNSNAPVKQTAHRIIDFALGIEKLHPAPTPDNIIKTSEATCSLHNSPYL